MPPVTNESPKGEEHWSPGRVWDLLPWQTSWLTFLAPLGVGHRQIETHRCHQWGLDLVINAHVSEGKDVWGHPWFVGQMIQAHKQTHAVQYHICMHHTQPPTVSPLSPPQLPYSWVGSVLSCIIMAQILPLVWPLLAFRPACVSLKCHVSADSVFWASMSIIWHATLWKPVDPLLTDTLIHFYVCGFVLCFYLLLYILITVGFIKWLPLYFFI